MKKITTKKVSKKMSMGSKVAIGAGVVLAGVGAYAFLGPDGKKNQKKVLNAVESAKKEITKFEKSAPKAVKKVTQKIMKAEKKIAKKVIKKITDTQKKIVQDKKGATKIVKKITKKVAKKVAKKISK